MAGRGAYDTTIEEEMARYRAGNISPRLNPQINRDEAVRRMNVRRDLREGRTAWNRESTAYTPEEAPRRSGGSRGKTSGGGKADTSHKGTPVPAKKPSRIPIPLDKPVQPGTEDPIGGTPLAPGYMKPDEPMGPLGPPGKNPDGSPSGGGPGGGPDGGGGPPRLPPATGNPLTDPIDPRSLPPALVPLLVAAGVSSQAGRGRMRAYPSPEVVDETIRTQGAPLRQIESPVIEGTVNQPYARGPINMPDQSGRQLALPPPRETVPAGAPQITYDPGQTLEIPLGDEKPRVRVRATTAPHVPPVKSKTSGVKTIEKMRAKPPRPKTKFKL